MLRFVFTALAFLSGSVALSHELLWTRRLIDLLGATESVTGRVLGLFFLGLSLGGWLASRWVNSQGNSAIRLGIAELCIAVLSLPALLLPLWADGLISTLGTDGLTSWQGSLIKLVLSAAVVLPPSIAMGTTMPLFIRVITQLGGTVRGAGVWLYSINMLGGVVGLWFVSTFLLNFAGVRGAMFWAAAGNVIISAVSFGLASRVASRSSAQEPSPVLEKELKQKSKPKQKQESLDSIDTPVTKWGNKGVYMLAFASGAMVLACEVLILRLLALVAPSSLQTTSALLASVILFLALGSIMVVVMNRLGLSSQIQLLIGAAGAALFCAMCPLVLYQTTNKLISIRYLVSLNLVSLNGQTIDSLTHYWILLFSIVAMSSGAAMFFSGFVFPSILSLHSKFDPQGRSVGLLLAVNGVGGLVGTEVANWLMIFQVGIYLGFFILAGLIASAAIAVCWFTDRQSWAIGLMFGVMLVGVFTIRPYQELRYLSPRATKAFTIEDTDFGRDGVLMVVKDQTQSRSMLMNNQYILGSSGTAVAAEQRQLLVPWLLHPEAEEVCCLGFATGISAAGLEALDSPPRVTSVELSEMVVDCAREFFAQENGAFFERDNRVVLEDGRTFIACSDNDYDLIVADLFRPHGAGEGRLFSVEHFQNAKRALRPGGLFCQWLPAHQLNQKQFEIVAATFRKVFPNTLVVTGSELSKTPTIGLCGWQDDAAWETADLVKKIGAIRSQKRVKDVLAVNAHLLIVGVLKDQAYSSAPINTLDNALLEIEAGKFWVLKDLRRDRPADTLENGFLSGENWKRFMRQLFEDTEPILAPIYREQYMAMVEKSEKNDGKKKLIDILQEVIRSPAFQKRRGAGNDLDRQRETKSGRLK